MADKVCWPRVLPIGAETKVDPHICPSAAHLYARLVDSPAVGVEDGTASNLSTSAIEHTLQARAIPLDIPG